MALFGTNKLASVDPKTLKLTEHALPNGSRPRRVDVTTDGRLYYVDYLRRFLGRLDPKTSMIDEWEMPSGRGARPYGMAVDSKDRIWFVETGRLFKRQGTAVESQVLPKVTLKCQTKQPGLSQ